ncbi:hypothetical protein TSOC_006214 [Tetrabaena socialis]|uniref:Uncharacterized protein n=1 Tax=Tetrabaena socialis TaxID=47790 RepID=A0A2J8A486_9CHLO|nr:hypothetical protein TSOC_006214 [Tetrabaena socialis]|eukprot:PNH07318.1 hypothetical protein TSOC_006214 [Tetrabaena socialis]
MAKSPTRARRSREAGNGRHRRRFRSGSQLKAPPEASNLFEHLGIVTAVGPAVFRVPSTLPVCPAGGAVPEGDQWWEKAVVAQAAAFHKSYR